MISPLLLTKPASSKSTTSNDETATLNYLSQRERELNTNVLGDEHAWNELLGKHFAFTSAKKQQQQKSIIDICEEIESVSLLMDEEKVSKMAEKLAEQNKKLMAISPSSSSTQNKAKIQVATKKLNQTHNELWAIVEECSTIAQSSLCV